jgi:type I restriction enzyme S subunit
LLRVKHIELSESEAADYWVEVGDVLATRYNGSVDLLGVFGMVKVAHANAHPDKLIRMKPLLGEQLGGWMEVWQPHWHRDAPRFESKNHSGPDRNRR